MRGFFASLLLVLWLFAPVVAVSQTVTRTFAENDPAIFESGYFASVSVGNPARAARQFASNGCRLDFLVTGSRCTLAGYITAANTLAVSIDGGALTPVNPAAYNTWSSLTLFSGLSDTAHSVRLMQINAFPRVSVDANAMLSVTGAAPALASPAAADPDHWGTLQYPVLNTTDDWPYLSAEAQTFAPLTGFDGYPSVLFNAAYFDGSLHFRAFGSAVRAWMVLDGTIWQATVDGVNQPVVTTANPSVRSWDWVTLASGLDSNVEHEVVLTNISQGHRAAVYALMFPRGSLDTGSGLSPRRLFLATGHSIVFGPYLPDLSSLYYQTMAQKRHYAIANRGVIGSTFLNFVGAAPPFSTQSGQARLSEALALQPDICLLDDFAYDAMNAAHSSPAERPADLQAALQSYLAAALSGCPNTQFYVLGILDQKGVNSFGPWNAAIQAAVLAQSSSRCQFISQTGWIDPTADTYDGVLPNVAGSQKIAAHLEPLVFPAPVAANQSVKAWAGSGAPITLAASQINGDGLTYSLVQQPTHGTLSGTPPNVVYTANSAYTGADSFTFQAADHYGAVSNTATVALTVLPPKINTRIAVADNAGVQFSGMLGQTIYLKGNVKRTSDSQGLLGETLTFQVDGTTVGTATTIDSGSAWLNNYQIPDNLTVGTHTITVLFAGDDQYNASSGTGTLTIQKTDTQVVVISDAGTQFSGNVGQTITLKGNVRRSTDRQGLLGRTLTFQVDGTTVGTATTVDSGSAWLYNYKIPNTLSAGDHTVTVSFSGDSQYNGSSGSGTLTVPYNTFVQTGNMSGSVGKPLFLRAVLRRYPDGQYVTGKSIAFQIDGTTVATFTTNASGLASGYYTLPANLSSGSHTLQAVFAGDGGYNASSQTATLTVNP